MALTPATGPISPTGEGEAPGRVDSPCIGRSRASLARLGRCGGFQRDLPEYPSTRRTWSLPSAPFDVKWRSPGQIAVDRSFDPLCMPKPGSLLGPTRPGRSSTHVLAARNRRNRGCGVRLKRQLPRPGLVPSSLGSFGPAGGLGTGCVLHLADEFFDDVLQEEHAGSVAVGVEHPGHMGSGPSHRGQGIFEFAAAEHRGQLA